MGYNPSYKWINPTYPIYNWGYNPLTKWVVRHQVAIIVCIQSIVPHVYPHWLSIAHPARRKNSWSEIQIQTAVCSVPVPFSWVIKCPHVSHHPTIGYMVYKCLLDGYYFRWCPIFPSHGTFTNPCFFHMENPSCCQTSFPNSTFTGHHLCNLWKISPILAGHSPSWWFP